MAFRLGECERPESFIHQNKLKAKENPALGGVSIHHFNRFVPSPIRGSFEAGAMIFSDSTKYMQVKTLYQTANNIELQSAIALFGCGNGGTCTSEAITNTFIESTVSVIRIPTPIANVRKLPILKK